MVRENRNGDIILSGADAKRVRNLLDNPAPERVACRQETIRRALESERNAIHLPDGSIRVHIRDDNMTGF